MNQEEKLVVLFTSVFWLLALAAYPAATLSERMNPTTARAEAAIGGSVLFLIIMSGAVLAALISVAYSLIFRKAMRGKFFLCGISPILMAFLLIGWGLFEDHRIATGTGLMTR